MPDAFQTVAPRAHDDRRFLAAARAPVQRRQIVGEDLQGVEYVIQVLDFGDGAQAAHRQADGLPDNRRLADARVGHAQGAILGLQAGESLIHAAQPADVFAKGHYFGMAGEDGVEGVVKDLKAAELRRFLVVDGGHRLQAPRALRRPARQVAAVKLAVALLLSLFPGQQNLLGGVVLVVQQEQGVAGALHQRPARRVLDPVQPPLDLGQLRGVARAAGDLVDDVAQLLPFLANGLHIGLPGLAPDTLDVRSGFLLHLVQLFFRGKPLLQNPQSHLPDSIPLLLPGEPFRRFVALVAA